LNYSIIKLCLVILVLFINNNNEYIETLDDLIEILNFKPDWEKVFTDLCLSLIHKGNSKYI